MLTFTYRDFLRWGLANLDLLDDLVTLALKLAQAQTIASGWEVIKEIGDLFVESQQPADDPMSVFCVDETPDLEQQLSSRLDSVSVRPTAWDADRLRRLWETLQPILPILLPLILGK